ncbi:hypothetical protein [Natronorubrum texcoconense]|nr:hypothetical protein [Natronorubrum texcoconense]
MPQRRADAGRRSAILKPILREHRRIRAMGPARPNCRTLAVAATDVDSPTVASDREGG